MSILAGPGPSSFGYFARGKMEMSRFVNWQVLADRIVCAVIMKGVTETRFL